MRASLPFLSVFIISSLNCGDDTPGPYTNAGGSECGDSVCGPGETSLNCATDCPCVSGQLGCPCEAGICASPWICNDDDRCIEEVDLCGNGTIDSGEQCDADPPAGVSCESIGYDGGSINCSDCELDTGGCVPYSTCGNGTLDTLEFCEGFELRNRTCVSEGYDGGTLTCTSECILDDSDCFRCGDGVKDAGEDCDGTSLDGQTCTSLVGAEYDGRLACTSSCDWNTRECYRPADLGAACGDVVTWGCPGLVCVNAAGTEITAIEPGWCRLPCDYREAGSSIGCQNDETCTLDAEGFYEQQRDGDHFVDCEEIGSDPTCDLTNGYTCTHYPSGNHCVRPKAYCVP